ncbi:MAG: restriction endonuclease subunit S, partial [bacterium]
AELTAELIGEQTLRQQQYEYYREKLLGEFEGEVEYKQLWEITNWDKKFQSVDPKKQDKVIKYKVLLSKEISELIREEGTVKLLTTNETNIYTTEELGVNYMSDGEVVAIPWGGNPIVQYYNGKFITSDNRIATSKDKNKYLNKYIYYYMKDNIDVISSFYRGSGIKHPDMSKVLDLTITIPSLEEQQRIVDILDRFDKLANDINEGLPAEIKLRQQQYEYYRDKLLTFKEKE